MRLDDLRGCLKSIQFNHLLNLREFGGEVFHFVESGVQLHPVKRMRLEGHVGNVSAKRFFKAGFQKVG